MRADYKTTYYGSEARQSKCKRSSDTNAPIIKFAVKALSVSYLLLPSYFECLYSCEGVMLINPNKLEILSA